MNATTSNGRASVAAEAAIAAYRFTHGHEPQYIKLYPCIANEAGVHEALIIQIIESWCRRNEDLDNRGYLHDGAWWTSLTYSEWIEKYPFLGTEGSIRKRIVAMEKARYIFSCQPQKKGGSSKKFYRVNSVKVGTLLLNASSVVTNSAELFNTEASVGNNIPPLRTNIPPLRTNSPHLPPSKPVTEGVSGSLLDYSIKLTNDLERSVVDFEKEEEPEWEKIGKETELEQAEHLSTNVEVPIKNSSTVNESSRPDQHSAAAPSSGKSNNEPITQNWECPEPKLRREFMGWLTETAKGIQTSRHAANWCNKNPQDADLAWDDFIESRKRSEAQITSFAAWGEERHQILLRTYRSAVQDAREGTHVFLGNFKAQNSAWLAWATRNRPEWFESSRSD